MKVFTVGELKHIVSESSNEFKPKFGSNVQSDNKKNNEKAYKDMETATKKYNGGIPSKPKKEHEEIMPNDNKGMSDIRYDGKVSKRFSDDNTSRLKGYVSKQAEDAHKNDEFGNADFDKEDTVKRLKNRAKAFKDGRDKATEIGLTGRELDKKEVEKLRSTMFGESKKIKQLNFKNETFISENHMLSRIPDEYKKEGNKFIMKDSSNNRYLVEWKEGEANVNKFVNMSDVENEKDRIKSLYEYKHGDDTSGRTNKKDRLMENDEFGKMLNKVRSLM